MPCAGRVREGTGSRGRPELAWEVYSCAVYEVCGPVASRTLSFLCFMQFSFTVFKCAFQFTFLPFLSLALQTAGHVSNNPNENPSLSNATVNVFPYIGVSVYTRDNAVNSLPRSPEPVTARTCGCNRRPWVLRAFNLFEHFHANVRATTHVSFRCS